MLNGLDLFSGYGGITLALSGWVRPVAYCENERYAQGILLSRMAQGGLPSAPIWDDVRTFEGHPWRSRVDIIYGGFPCQDISIAGAGKGLEGKRSGLFVEIMRLAEEIEPSFIFLENVPAIRTRGLREVVRALSDAGYDSRWTSISAQEVGAPHKRERWFLLASHPDSLALWNEQQRESWRLSNGIPNERQAEPRVDGFEESLANAASERSNEGITELKGLGWKGEPDECSQQLANTECDRLQRTEHPFIWQREANFSRRLTDESFARDWLSTEPDVGRVVNGLVHRVDRVRALGNGVVPLQAREAFKELMGLS